MEFKNSSREGLEFFISNNLLRLDFAIVQQNQSECPWMMRYALPPFRVPVARLAAAQAVIRNRKQLIFD